MSIDPEPTEKKKIKTGKSKKSSDDNDILRFNEADNMTHKNLVEGMTVLGRVHNVTKYEIIVSLPGHMRGQVKITNVSESYTKLLEEATNSSEGTSEEFKHLTDLYQNGDYVVCYVMANDYSENFVSLSMEPEQINANLNPSTLQKGSTVVCTVNSVEDHVYVMETGVKNIRAFLQKKQEHCTSHTCIYNHITIMKP